MGKRTEKKKKKEAKQVERNRVKLYLLKRTALRQVHTNLSEPTKR